MSETEAEFVKRALRHYNGATPQEIAYCLGISVDEANHLFTLARRGAAANEITTLRAEVERLRIENIQMQAALGYGILAEDERHIIPTNPYKCGTCDASSTLRARIERLETVLGALGVIGGGYCFCSHTRDPDKTKHQPECRDARAALEDK